MEAIVREALSDDRTVPYSVLLSGEHRRKLDVLLHYAEKHHARYDIALTLKLFLLEFGSETKECQAAVVAYLCAAEVR
jgi:hypothetical protein